MKTRNFAATKLAPKAQVSGRRLLCKNLRSPAEVSFFTPVPELAAFWRPVRALWEQNQRVEALALLDDTARRPGQYSSVSIPTFLLLVHLRMEDGDGVGAERCLQAAAKELGQQTGMTAKAHFSRRSRTSAGGRIQPYALCGREWLILAIQSLLKNDMASCLVWIHQADRRVFEPAAASESPQRLRLIGDLHAVLACVAAQTDEMDQAEKFLATAYQRHMQAEAFQSACRDLILTSRLAMRQGQAERAQSLLDAAECQLVISLTPTETDRSPLMDIIHSDRMQEAVPFEE